MALVVHNDPGPLHDVALVHDAHRSDGLGDGSRDPCAHFQRDYLRHLAEETEASGKSGEALVKQEKPVTGAITWMKTPSEC